MSSYKFSHISFSEAHCLLCYCLFSLTASCCTNHSDRSQTVSVNTVLYFSSWLNGNGCHMSLAICQSGYCMFVVMVEESTMTLSPRFVCLETDLAFSQCHPLIWKSAVSQTNLLGEDECFLFVLYSWSVTRETSLLLLFIGIFKPNNVKCGSEQKRNNLWFICFYL